MYGVWLRMLVCFFCIYDNFGIMLFMCYDNIFVYLFFGFVGWFVNWIVVSGLLLCVCCVLLLWLLFL